MLECVEPLEKILVYRVNNGESRSRKCEYNCDHETDDFFTLSIV